MEKSDHDLLIEIHTMLLGADGKSGLTGEVEQQSEDLSELRKCFNKFKLQVCLVMGILIGMGIFQGTISLF